MHNYKDRTEATDKSEEFKYHAYTYLSQYLDTIGDSATDEDLHAKVFENIKELYFPDRELETSLHRLFSKKKFPLLNEIKEYLENEPLEYEHTENRFKYIYEYHFKFKISDLNSIYSNFEYLFNDSEFDDLDEEWKALIRYFSKKLRKVSENISKNLNLDYVWIFKISLQFQ